jgi:hypothetical protein
LATLLRAFLYGEKNISSALCFLDSLESSSVGFNEPACPKGNYRFMSFAQPILLLSKHIDQAIGPSDQGARDLISGGGGIQGSGLMARAKRAMIPASILSVLVRISSLWANPLIRAGLTILAV